jgi:hypothetical protein
VLRRAGASFAFVLALLPCGVVAQLSAPDPALAVAALRVATLAERIAKLQVQSAHGVLAERSRRALQETVRELDVQVKRARTRAAPAEVRDQLLLVAILCDEQRPWALRTPSRENARRVVERTEETVWAAQKAARLAGASESPAIVAQRAALLSQRVSRLHLARRGAGDEGTAELANAEGELRQGLAWLAAAPGNSAQVDSELQLAHNQLEFLSPAAGSREAPARRLEFAAKAGDHLLESMTRLVRLYEGS